LRAPDELPGWREVPLARLLQDRSNLPVRLENDANAAALGEWRFGAGRGATSRAIDAIAGRWATALGWHATALTKPGDGSALRTLSHDVEVTGRHVVEAARGGDEAALALIGREARWLGIGFTNLLHLYSPDMIVMGGGISHGYNLLRKPLEATIQERAMPAFRDVPVVPNSVGMPA
jgi:glucokinase